MMSAPPLKQQKLFGLFELDPAGTVRYSRVEPDDGADSGVPDMAGHNFFDEIPSSYT